MRERHSRSPNLELTLYPWELYERYEYGTAYSAAIVNASRLYFMKLQRNLALLAPLWICACWFYGAQ